MKVAGARGAGSAVPSSGLQRAECRVTLLAQCRHSLTERVWQVVDDEIHILRSAHLVQEAEHQMGAVWWRGRDDLLGEPSPGFISDVST